MQKLRDEGTGETVDPLRDLGIDVVEVTESARDLSLAHLFCLAPELGEKRLDLELPVPATELVDLLLDNRLDLRNLAQT